MLYFEYCTIQDLRDEGITPQECSDARALTIIRRASAKINIFTSQWFAPVVGDQYIDGQNSRMVWLPNYVPIQKLTAIEVLSTRTARVGPHHLPDRRVYEISLSDVELARNNRVVELITDVSSSGQPQSRWYGDNLEEIWFPEGRRNVHLTGVFGWLEDEKDVSSTVVGDWALRSPKIQLTSVAGWDDGDVCVFPDGSLQIVTGVLPSANEIYFRTDSLKLKTAVTDGQTLVTYGRIPQLIRYATIRLAVRMYPKAGDFDEQEELMSQAIVSEKTDNYSYKLDASLLRERIEAGANGTGDAEVDSILSQMIDETPMYVGFV